MPAVIIATETCIRSFRQTILWWNKPCWNPALNLTLIVDINITSVLNWYTSPKQPESLKLTKVWIPMVYLSVGHKFSCLDFSSIQSSVLKKSPVIKRDRKNITTYWVSRCCWIVASLLIPTSGWLLLKDNVRWSGCLLAIRGKSLLGTGQRANMMAYHVHKGCPTTERQNL